MSEKWMKKDYEIYKTLSRKKIYIKELYDGGEGETNESLMKDIMAEKYKVLR